MAAHLRHPPVRPNHPALPVHIPVLPSSVVDLSTCCHCVSLLSWLISWLVSTLPELAAQLPAGADALIGPGVLPSTCVAPVNAHEL